MQRLPLAVLLLAIAVHAGEIRGGALVDGSGPAIYTWGDELKMWPLDGLAPRTLLSGRRFESGGCAVREGLVLQEDGKAILISFGTLKESVIEVETRFANCLEFSIGGRRGVLIPHLDAQLRFFLFPHFEAKEIYSIYTASRQGGLIAHDVDRDGKTDVFFGNYWVRNPGALDVAWRLYAVNLIHDTPDAALAAMALFRKPGADHPDLIWAESVASPARIFLHERPPDPRQLWPATPLRALGHPRAILSRGGMVFIGHDSGLALLTWRRGAFRRSDLSRGARVLGLAEKNDQVYAITPDGVQVVYPLR